MNNSKIPLSLYIHFPWCLRKCPYCDFSSRQLTDNSLIEPYVNKLIADLKSFLIGERQLVSIYFGGGTPSLMAPKFIEKIILEASQHFKTNIEISLEANPGTIDKNICRDLLHAGINRLSIGAQSFQDEKLKNLGRIHDSKQACAAIEAAKIAGFENLNIDLMFGLPEQKIADSLYDLEIAAAFNPQHISWYQLTLESGTPFALNPPRVPTQDYLWEMQEQGQKFLADSGFEHYEVSAYCKPNFACRHNINYWEYGDYLGIGDGACSKLSFTRNISQDEIIFEFMLNALRLFKPISYALFEERTGLAADLIRPKLQLALDLELIKLNNAGFEATTKGRNFLNNLLEIFIV